MWGYYVNSINGVTGDINSQYWQVSNQTGPLPTGTYTPFVIIRALFAWRTYI